MTFAINFTSYCLLVCNCGGYGESGTTRICTVRNTLVYGIRAQGQFPEW